MSGSNIDVARLLDIIDLEDIIEYHSVDTILTAITVCDVLNFVANRIKDKEVLGVVEASEIERYAREELGMIMPGEDNE